MKDYKSGHFPKRDFTVPTPKLSRHSDLTFISHDSLKETEFRPYQSLKNFFFILTVVTDT